MDDAQRQQAVMQTLSRVVTEYVTGVVPVITSFREHDWNVKQDELPVPDAELYKRARWTFETHEGYANILRLTDLREPGLRRDYYAGWIGLSLDGTTLWSTVRWPIDVMDGDGRIAVGDIGRAIRAPIEAAQERLRRWCFAFKYGADVSAAEIQRARRLHVDEEGFNQLPWLIDPGNTQGGSEEYLYGNAVMRTVR